jgi:hypothetical protein
LGQFLNEDPLGFDARDANLRRYVANGPLDAVDPSGLEELFQRSTIDCHQPPASSMGTNFDLSLLSDRQYEPNTTPAAPDPPAYPNTLSGKHLWMAELMMDGVVGNPDAIRREVQRQYAVSQNTPIRALIGSADDFVNGRTESVTPGEVKQYAESVLDAAKGYFIDGPTQVTQEAFELVDDVLTRGPTAMLRDLGTMVGTLWSSPDARDQAFTELERSFQECLDNPEKGGAALFKLTFSVLGGEEVAARSMVEWTKRAGSAGRLLGHLDDVNLGDASRLGTMTDTVGAPSSGPFADRLAKVAARTPEEIADRALRADALKLHETFERGIARNGVTVTTAELDGKMVYAVSNNRTSLALRQKAEHLGYERIFGRKYTGPLQTDAEQILLNYADDVGAQSGRLAPSRPACGPSRQNCAGRIDATPGMRLIGPRKAN